MTHEQLEFIGPDEMGAEIDSAFALATGAAREKVLDAARGVLRRLLLTQPTVHSNDFWEAASAWCPPEMLAAMIRHSRAINTLWLAAKRLGWVVESGEWRTSNRRSSHRRSIVWRSCLYGTAGSNPKIGLLEYEAGAPYHPGYTIIRVDQHDLP